TRRLAVGGARPVGGIERGTGAARPQDHRRSRSGGGDVGRGARNSRSERRRQAGGVKETGRRQIFFNDGQEKASYLKRLSAILENSEAHHGSKTRSRRLSYRHPVSDCARRTEGHRIPPTGFRSQNIS